MASQLQKKILGFAKFSPPVIKVTGKYVKNGKFWKGTICTGRPIDDPSKPGKCVDTDIITVNRTLDIEISKDGKTIKNKEPVIFYGDVTLEFISPYKDYSYWAQFAPNPNFVGNRSFQTGLRKNKYAETYYSLNGKDPIRTKKYLWIKRSIIIRHNKTNGGKTIIKAKTYYQGLESKVSKLEIRIIRSVPLTY